MALFGHYITHWAQNVNVAITAKCVDFAQSEVGYIFLKLKRQNGNGLALTS